MIQMRPYVPKPCGRRSPPLDEKRAKLLGLLQGAIGSVHIPVRNHLARHASSEGRSGEPPDQLADLRILECVETGHDLMQKE